ncbi:TlpA family protein disulfide reductase [Salinimicrobium sp. GXAS 041]|uniref:TlpA family protein disulfide reductase n=1 Tax=Salinimicrobium sp. GXAS 041 TaxID=3400806 RepID=UPI003C77439B
MKLLGNAKKWHFYLSLGDNFPVMNSNLSAKFLFSCSFVFLFLSCKEKKEPEETSLVEEAKIVEKEEANAISNHVIFTITTDDKYGLDGLTLLDYSNFFGSQPQGLPRDTFKDAGDSVQFVLKEIRQPQLMEIFNMAETQNSTRFLVTPGDTIKLQYQNGTFKFFGDNAAHYNFYAGLDSNDYAQNPYRGNFQKYKASTEDIYNRRKAYFKKYLEENLEVSEAFKEQVAAELKYEYLYNLVAPRTIKAKGLEGIYFNNMEGIAAILTGTRRGNEQMLDLQAYFDGVDIEDLQHPELVNNDYFKRNLVDLVRHYFAQNEVPGYTRENLKRELTFIRNNFSEELKTVATGKLLWEYHRKDFGRGREDRNFFQERITEYKKQNLPPSYLEEISIIEEELALMDSNLPTEIRNEKLVSLQGDTLTMGEVMDRAEGKIKYLDFWASWCPPCIVDFTNSQEFKERLTAEKNVEFIYISVEKDRERWQKKSALLKEVLAPGEQYKILNVENSRILTFLKIRGLNEVISVPRYTVMDESGKIISANAPRLLDSVSVKELLKISE